MNFVKHTVCLAAAFCTLFSLTFPARAADEDRERFVDKSWDEVVEAFLEEYDIPPDHVALGYKNTVTGEEHFLNGDSYFIAASIFKVPLNMVFTEQVYRGEMSFDDEIAGVPYAQMLELTIIESSNSLSYLLWNALGSYREYRDCIAPYMGVDPETADKQYYRGNHFTARQVIHCLNLLQTESERFPGLIDAMRRAEPENYFNFHKQKYEIAHKYGYLDAYNVDGRRHINDCAIVYTDEPIVIVMFAAGVNDAINRLADYCTLMADYAQYHTELRRAEEAQVTPSPSPSPSPAPTAAPTPAPTPTPTASPAPVLEKDAEALPVVAAVAAAAAVLLLACAAVFFRNRRYRK